MRPYDASPCFGPDRTTTQTRKFCINRTNTRHGGRGLLPGEKLRVLGGGGENRDISMGGLRPRRRQRAATTVSRNLYRFSIGCSSCRGICAARRSRTMALGRGDSVLEIGCGTGRNFPYLREAVGPDGPHLRRRHFTRHAARGAGAPRGQGLAQYRALRMRCRRLRGAGAARRGAVQPVLQHHAASSHRAAARLATASSRRPSRHHGRQGAAGMAADAWCCRSASG